MPSAKMTRNQLFVGACLVLALVTLIVYWPITHHGFTNIDDDGYITANPHVGAGATWSGVVWAFKTEFAGNWHPLTMITLMLEHQIYGSSAAGYHLTSLLFHIVNTLLLFLLLNEMTGALWRSAFVAALFAWHPLHVESVAWAAERKDVLSAFFWMLTLLAYVQYVKKSNAGRYFLTLLMFAFGLMSKPMVVTLPFVLLLMDYWPLRRLRLIRESAESTSRENRSSLIATDTSPRQSVFVLVFEKLPFFALALVINIVTYLAQKSDGAIWHPPIYTRMANALTAYLRYISKTFWPVDLAVVYPYSRHWPVGLVIFALLFLAIWSALFVLWARRRPYLIVGWCWFLGALFPTIGLVQAGVQSMADRYTYIPSIGLFILVVWGINDFLDLRPHKRKIAALAGTMALGSCLACSWLQSRYWQNSITLFLHAIQVTTDNYLAYNCLGNALEELGRKDEALALYTESVRVEPTYAPGQFNLGMMLLERGKLDEASNHLGLAVQLTPRNAIFQFDLGTFLLQHGNLDEAANHFTAALDVAPDFTSAHNGLAQVLYRQNKPREAISQYREALRSWPDFPEAHNGLGLILLQQNKLDDAITQLSEAVRLKPDYAEAKTNLAAALAKRGKK
jgi:Flp pilus assembly protein TadD